MKTYLHKKACIRTVTATIVMMSQNQKQCKCPSSTEWTNKLQFIRIMEHISNYSIIKRKEPLKPAATWMSLKNMPNERCQVQKATYRKIAFKWNIYKRQVYRCRKISCSLGLRVGARTNCQQAQGKILRLWKCSNCGGLWWWLHNTINSLKSLNETLIMVNFGVSILYLIKAVKKKINGKTQ